MEDSHDEANWTQHPPPGAPELLARRSYRPRRDSHSRKQHRDSHLGEPDHERERERDRDLGRVSSKSKMSSAHGQRGGTRYKEKFQIMRERYDRTLAMRDTIERDLTIAKRKEEWIENENNLLLDAIYAAEPELLKFVHPPFRSPVLTPLQSPVHTPRELPPQVNHQPYPYSAHSHTNSRAQAHTPHSHPLHARPSPHLHPTPRPNHPEPHPQRQHAPLQALHQEEAPVPAPAPLSARASPIPVLRPLTQSPRSPPHLGPNVSNERGHAPTPARTHAHMDMRDREGREQQHMQTQTHGQVPGHEANLGVSPRPRPKTEPPTPMIPVSAPVPTVGNDPLNRDRPENGLASTNGVSDRELKPGSAGHGMQVETHERPPPPERENGALQPSVQSTSEPQRLSAPPG